MQLGITLKRKTKADDNFRLPDAFLLFLRNSRALKVSNIENREKGNCESKLLIRLSYVFKCKTNCTANNCNDFILFIFLTTEIKKNALKIQ